MGIFKTHLLSLLSSPTLLKKKKSNLHQVMLTCWATDTVKVVLQSSHSRITDGLNHVVSTVP